MVRSEVNCSAVLAADKAATNASPVLVPGPKLRQMLGISAVTLWRWRHDPSVSFPQAKVINHRLYFSYEEVMKWCAQRSTAN